jgi:single-stranded DNA-specific DHH superfamily exonuclease
MAIPDEELHKFKERVLAAKRPLFFYDDDCDGLCSFLTCVHSRGDGVGVRMQNSATVTPEFLRKVDENLPDLIVVLDKPYIDQQFIDGTSIPILWLDHHAVQHPKGDNITYLNPRQYNDLDNRCTTYWVYKALGNPKYLWLAAVGSVADWQLNEYVTDFQRQKPELLTTMESPSHALFSEPFGTLCKMIYFNLKGDAGEVRTAIKILTRIETPEELLAHTSPRAKLLHKRFEVVNKQYERLLRAAKAHISEDPILYHIFPHMEISLISELSNQLLHEYPDKIIFVGREHNGETKFSIRGSQADIASAVKAAMATGIRGNSGGHTHACGGNIPSEDFHRFVTAFKANLKLQ